MQKGIVLAPAFLTYKARVQKRTGFEEHPDDQDTFFDRPRRGYRACAGCSSRRAGHIVVLWQRWLGSPHPDPVAGAIRPLLESCQSVQIPGPGQRRVAPHAWEESVSLLMGTRLLPASPISKRRAVQQSARAALETFAVFAR